jgi:hypothetical protein
LLLHLSIIFARKVGTGITKAPNLTPLLLLKLFMA